MTRNKKGQQRLILTANPLGFCFGVRRAIKIIKEASRNNHNIVTLGPIVHNKEVVNQLQQSGVQMTDDFNCIDTSTTLVISSHGISPQKLQQIRDKGINVIDTTCPNVKHAQQSAQKLFIEGYSVIIFGETSHPEVKGLLGWAGEKAVATTEVKELMKVELGEKVGILSQTTQSREALEKFIQEFISVKFDSLKELKIINTLCNETRKRQKAATELAKKSDIMLVVGGFNSANTKNLAKICSNLVETYHVESAEQIKPEWLKNKKHIGITAGASTPDKAIEEVISRLKNLLGYA